MRSLKIGAIAALAVGAGLLLKAGHPDRRGRHGRRERHKGWDQETVPQRFQPMLERWHRDAHASAEGGTDPTPPVPAGDPAPA